MASQHSHAWHTFPKGTRVLDTVTGMDGVVLDSHITHAVEPAGAPNATGEAGRLLPLPNPIVHESVVVKLEDGATVQRSPRTLVAL